MAKAKRRQGKSHHSQGDIPNLDNTDFNLFCECNNEKEEKEEKKKYDPKSYGTWERSRKNGIVDINFIISAKKYICPDIDQILEKDNGKNIFEKFKRETGKHLFSCIKNVFPGIFLQNIESNTKEGLLDEKSTRKCIITVEDLLMHFVSCAFEKFLSNDRDFCMESTHKKCGKKLYDEFKNNIMGNGKDLFGYNPSIENAYNKSSVSLGDIMSPMTISSMDEINSSIMSVLGKNKNIPSSKSKLEHIIAKNSSKEALQSQCIPSNQVKELLLEEDDIYNIFWKRKFLPEIRDKGCRETIKRFFSEPFFNLTLNSDSKNKDSVDEGIMTKDFAWFAFGEACKQYLIRKSCEKSLKHPNDILALVPKESDLSSLMSIFSYASNHLFMDVYIIAQSGYSKESLKLSVDAKYNRLEERIKKLIENGKERTEQIAKQKREIEKWKKKVESTQELEKELDALKKKISNLESSKEEVQNARKELSKSKKEIERLQEKCNNLKENNEILNSMLSREQEKNNEKDSEKELLENELKKFDCNEVYAFACYDDNVFNTKIKDMFPNVIFVSDTTELNKETIKVAVVLVNHVGHTTMYNVKEQCTKKGIPVVYTNSSNLEKIKEMMVRELIKQTA